MNKRVNAEQHLESNAWKGLFAGLVGGLAASVVMNLYQKSFSKYITGEKRSHGAQSLQKGSPDHGAGKMLKEKGKENSEDDAAERLANAVSVGLFDHELTEKEKDKGGRLCITATEFRWRRFTVRQRKFPTKLPSVREYLTDF